MPQMHPDMAALLKAREQTNAQLGARAEDPVEARRWWNVYASILSQPHPAGMRVYDRTRSPLTTLTCRCVCTSRAT